MMKLKSLVTVNYYVTANYCNNFAHTAHHIQRVFILKRVKFFFLERRKLRIRKNFTRAQAQKKKKHSIIIEVIRIKLTQGTGRRICR